MSAPAITDLDRRAPLSGAAVRRCPVCRIPTGEDTPFCSPQHRTIFAQKVQRAAAESDMRYRPGRLGVHVPGSYADPSLNEEAVKRRRKRKEEKCL
jgi:hypothetical protein